jgi:hypothetical protein
MHKIMFARHWVILQEAMIAQKEGMRTFVGRRRDKVTAANGI